MDIVLAMFLTKPQGMKVHDALKLLKYSQVNINFRKHAKSEIKIPVLKIL